MLTVDSNDCRTGKYLRPNPQNPPTSGRLASISAIETRCGSQDKPWLIEVSHGQRINVTLVDFTTRRTRGPPPTGSASSQDLREVDGNACVRYVTVVEKRIEEKGGEGDESFVICGRQGRERHVYTSKSNVIQIQLEASNSNPDYFLINYEGITVNSLRLYQMTALLLMPFCRLSASDSFLPLYVSVCISVSLYVSLCLFSF